MKTHPFFNGVDFAAISLPNYKDVKAMVDERMPQQYSNEDAVERQSVGNILGMAGNPLVDHNAVVLQGNICKRNWFGAVQVRFFELYRYGEIKYYKDIKEYKGSITLGPNTKVIREGR